MAGTELVLYVTGSEAGAGAAVEHARQLAAERLGGCALTVVDTLEQPGRAAADAVRVTPTLIRRQPPPERRVVGDLADAGAVLRGLGLEGAS